MAAKNKKVKRYQVRWKYGELVYSYGTGDLEEAITLMNQYAAQENIGWVEFRPFTVSQEKADQLDAAKIEPNTITEIGRPE